MLSDRDQRDEQHDREPDPDLRRGVLQTLEHAAEAHGAAAAGDHQREERDEPGEQCEQEDLPAEAGL